jgi:hypothetical protein
MKSAFKGFLLFFLLLLAGCDPGMTIRQVTQHDRVQFSPQAPAPTGLLIYVKTSHLLIGENWYAPTVTVTNSLNASITISSVELIAKGITYANKPRQTGTYPLAVDPGQTQSLDVWFDLRDDVRKTFFKQSAELRVHYRSDGKEQIGQTVVVGGHLNR